MNYVVLDLEWNQAMSSKSSVFNKLPFHLRGEIIQIGAVKLNVDMTPGEEFQCDVRPVYFRKMHHRVKKITGFDKERLENGLGFAEAMESFQAFCGDNCTFLTWGYDDQGVMEQNIMLHDLEWDWIDKWVNLQLIYNVQTGGDRNQKALSTAMEHFEIPQTRVAHDALGDAYNTALVCSHLDMELGLRQYDDAQRILAERRARLRQQESSHQRGSGDMPIQRLEAIEFASKEEVFENPDLTTFSCVDCGTPLTAARWVNQGDKRYMALVNCPEHGSYLLRLKLRKDELDRWSASRLVYRADEEVEAFFKAKATQSRKKRKRRARAKRATAKKAE